MPNPEQNKNKSLKVIDLIPTSLRLQCKKLSKHVLHLDDIYDCIHMAVKY
jgi:hypothetical protein